MFNTLVQDALSAFPILGWVLLAVLALVVQILTHNRKAVLWVSLLGLIGLFIYGVFSLDSNLNTAVFFNTARIDSITQILNLLGLGIVGGVLVSLIPGLDEPSKLMQKSYEQFPEFLICLLFTGFGLSVLVSAIDLTSLFLGLETLSISLYCLCGFYRTEIQSTEAAFKYLMIGAFATVIFLYGVAFLYGATGSTQYALMQDLIQKNPTGPLVTLGCLFLLGGFGFKLAFVPFHFYAADVYEGAPTPISGLLASIVKVGVLGAVLRLFWGVLEPLREFWIPLWTALCVTSILVGNIVALQQRTIKKLFAFSSISHAGFLGLALLVADPQHGGTNFPLFAYLILYSAMAVGTFSLLSYLERRDRAEPFWLDDLRGLAQRRFKTALCLGIFVIGMAGLPPFSGFMAKLWILQGLVQQGYIWSAFAAVLGSLIGAGYYLKILLYVFISQEHGAASAWTKTPDRYLLLRFIVIVAALVTIFGGLRPQFYADWILASLPLK